MSYATAERDYFDPRDPEPVCDICDEPQFHLDRPEDSDSDWNGETGCHITCEERQVDEELS